MKTNNELTRARVTEAHKNSYIISAEGKDYYADLAGKLIYREEYPVVGDYVYAIITEGSPAVIAEIEERKTVICRPDRKGHADGFVKTISEQVMVSNLDYCFIVTSLNYDFSANRIVRYTAIAHNGGVKPVIILSKADICPDKERYFDEIKRICPEADVICISSYTGEGLDKVKEYFRPGNTIATIGSSGAGKSTLINTIAGREVMRASEIRETDSKGRHTTTHRQLIDLDGVYIIDTPGMREIGVCDISEGLEETFDDIAELESCCRYSDCQHKTEPGCAIKAALENGELSAERWELYRKLQMESNRSRAMKAKKIIDISKARNALKKR